MSAPVPSDGNQVETSATNSHQPGSSPSTILDASRRQPSSSTPGAAELASQPIGALTSEDQQKLATAKQLVIDNLRYEPDFPIPGIKFIDILPIFQNPAAFSSLLDVLVLLIRERFGSQVPDVIVGLEARGFLFGPPLALRLNRPFVPVRKKGKMPGACRTVEYTKEYGKDEFQVQTSAIKPGQQCLIVDDIIATGGTAAAAGKLVELSEAHIMGYLFMIDIINLKGTLLLGDKPIITLIEHNEEE
ncbi:phosphoribosyltransferase-like protein [Xylaria bambusicola]|uniref:phosphoribosyltransferase-like protein n=1 Tax=Xylaria bambusicola TaxID=326684 RepID=UPI002007469E|nr:phosphoribosyltransferase-like protein [Xylaria bambusicola]KAI0505676.1 phosphoribosyltransferase-like protein [Xylaria bambusicola]